MTYHRVKRARYIKGYAVEFIFMDGSSREIDLEPFLHGGIFEPLRSMEASRSFKIGHGTIVWPNGADIAPETLYLGLGPIADKAEAGQAFQ
jgi:hypothetical protein